MTQQVQSSSQKQRQQTVPSGRQVQPAPSSMPIVEASRDPQSRTGTAFRELKCILDMPEGDEGLVAASGAIGNVGNVTSRHVGSSGVVGVLHEAFDADMKSVLGGADKNVSNIGRDGIGPMKTDQAGDLLHNFLDETDQSPFTGTGGENQRRRGGHSASEIALRRHPAGEMGEMGERAIHSGGQIVLEAVTAAASGKGGWDTRGSGTSRHVVNGDGGDDVVDVGMQLFSVTAEGDLSIQPEGENGARSDVSRQGVPPGLSDFTPQADVEDQDGGGEARRRRMQAGGQPNLSGLKEVDGIQPLQRFVPGKTKPESCSSAVRQNGRTSGGRNEANGGIGIGRKNGTQGEIGKVGKEGSRNGGLRRGTLRKSGGGGEGREKRQKTSGSSTADAR